MAEGTSRRERKVVTVVFCDLVGFTARAESMDPEDVEALLRPYHARVRAELERHGGTVEKFIGTPLRFRRWCGRLVPTAHSHGWCNLADELGIRDGLRKALDADVGMALPFWRRMIELALSGDMSGAADVVGSAGTRLSRRSCAGTPEFAS